MPAEDKKCCCGRITIINLLCALFCIWECWAFVSSVSSDWFNPLMTTDDALQQAVPFYDAEHPEIFSDDIIAELVRGYLAPLQYWLGYGITKLTHDPIMTCHWMMLIQLAVTLGFLFLAVRSVAGFAPAALAVAWFVHTRPVVQRITGGLPRGWAAAVICAFLFFALTKRHKCVLVVILCGCLLHPPATLIVAAAYGLYLLLSLIPKDTRKEAKLRFWRYVAMAPLYALITFYVVQRPENFGQMVDYKTAASMPEFSRPYGRFPFVPLDRIDGDWRMNGFQPFFHYLHNSTDILKNFGLSQDRVNLKKWKDAVCSVVPSFFCSQDRVDLKKWKDDMCFVVPFFFCLLFYLAWRRKRCLPAENICLFVAIILVYFASRLLAFKLYVPNRHLQFPMTVAWISAFTILIWQAFNKAEDVKDTAFRKAWPALLVSLLVGVVVWIGSGDGMYVGTGYGDANFNYPLYKKGKVFVWLKKNTPENALIAGHPLHIDALPLFAMRRAFATNETAHPFYPNYYKEIERRLIISFRAHYARDWHEFINLLEPEHIDYFVFKRKAFYPEALQKETYHVPLKNMVEELASYDSTEYVYKKMPPQVDLREAPYLVFKDEESAVVDVKALRAWLDKEDAKGGEDNAE